MRWVGTFKHQIGEDAIMNHFCQLHDGVILFKITKCVTKSFIKKSE